MKCSLARRQIEHFMERLSEIKKGNVQWEEMDNERKNHRCYYGSASS